MNIGLVGWGIASGNGGMNSDIASLASWVTHWLVPKHPTSPNHTEYLEKAKSKQVRECNLEGDDSTIIKFLDDVDGILYVEHPCLKEKFDIVHEAKKRGKLTIGIPMWEWWPERKSWALETDILWSVTKTTQIYLNSLSNVLTMHGYSHAWRGRVYGSRWGVNLSEFQFTQRKTGERIVFINGNGGYKLRKASDAVFRAFSRPDSPPLTVYTQKSNIALPSSKNIQIIERNFPERADVYADGDIFLFPSYWEGLCHGIYEAQACGGVVVTSDHPPMNECGTPYLVPIDKLTQEDLSGKKICKAHPSELALHEICRSLHRANISSISKNGRKLIEEHFNLLDTLNEIYRSIIEDQKENAHHSQCS